jgi:amidase
MPDLAFRTATELLADLRDRKLSCRELLEHQLGRVERLNPRLNAIVTLDAERARRRADEADAALARGERWGPLHGLPMTVKDCFETAGLRTTAGAPQLADHVPTRDAVAVARLRAAGAVIFGKTNTPTLAMDWQTHNPVFGTTGNPFDLARTPGGSSGGSAAAVAAGLAPLELGSDIGGSIRWPSHCCGVFGHKPTWGLVPERGHIPGRPGWLVEDDVNVVGPLARDAGDLALALDVLAGPAPEAARAWRLELPPPRHDHLRDYRIAAWLDDPFCAVSANVRERLEAAVAALRAEGARVDERARPEVDFAESFRLYQRLLGPLFALAADPARARGLRAAAAGLPDDDPRFEVRMLRDAASLHVEWLEAHQAREALRARWADFFREWDAVLCPIAPVPAIPHDHRDPLTARRIQVDGRDRDYTDLWSWPALIGVALLPATAVPLGRTREGLPVGLQIVTGQLADRTGIDLARRLAGTLGGFEIPPGW